MPSLIHKMSKMSWNIYYKYVANAPQNQTFISQFPRGEHPGPFLFLPPLVVASFPPPPIPFQIWLCDPRQQATVTVSTPFHSCGKMAGVGNAEKLSLIYLLFFFVCLFF